MFSPRPPPSPLLLLLHLITITLLPYLLLIGGAHQPQSGCLQSGQPLCCAGRNMSCKSLEEPRTPIFSFALRDDQVREVRFGKNCIGRIVLPDLISLNDRGQDLLRQLGHHEHFRLYKEIRRIRRSATESDQGQEETVIQFGWEQEQMGAERWETEDDSPIIRYSLLSRQLPLRIVKRRLRTPPTMPRGRQTIGGWSAGDQRRMYFLAESRPDCFCDQFCPVYGDCCANYRQVCPPVDCEVSGWSRWSECIPDDGVCGVGLMERSRTVLRERQNAGTECPELAERVGCFRECGTGRRDEDPRVAPDITTVALLLDYQYNASRQTLPSTFFKQQLHKRKTSRRWTNSMGQQHQKKDYVKYCVQYQIEWLNRECTEPEWRTKLASGQLICAECQPEAQFHRPRPRCASDLEDGQSGFWKLIGPKYCYGIWRRLNGTLGSAIACDCSQNFPRLSPFLLV